MPNWKKLIVSGSDAALNSLNITSALTASGLIYPTTDGDNGDFLTTDGIGNLSFGRPNVYANVKNISGGQLLKGTPVHATGTAGNASEVIASSASVASSMPATFILNETLADDAEGLAILTGYINGINTSAFGEGDVVYVGSTGSFTNIKPQGSDNLIQNLGIVTKVHASNGSGYVYGSGRSNDVPNLPEGKIWVGSSTYTVTSSIVHLDETNSTAQITGSLDVQGSVTGSSFTGSFVGDGSGLAGVVAEVIEQATVSDTFTSTTSKVVTHNFDTKNIIVIVYNSLDQQILPATLTTTDNNNVTVTFDTATSGRVVVAKGGHIVSGSVTYSALIGKPFFEGSQTNITSGSVTNINTIPTSSYSAAIFDYAAYSSSNARAGTLTSTNVGTTITYNEVSTSDIGDTTPLELSVVISGSNFTLQALTSTSGWAVKSQGTGI